MCFVDQPFTPARLAEYYRASSWGLIHRHPQGVGCVKGIVLVDIPKNYTRDCLLVYSLQNWCIYYTTDVTYWRIYYTTDVTWIVIMDIFNINGTRVPREDGPVCDYS